MKIKSTISWPRGRKTIRFIDLSNTNERHQFAQFAEKALSRGAIVQTQAIAIEPDFTDNRNTIK